MGNDARAVLALVIAGGAGYWLYQHSLLTSTPIGVPVGSGAQAPPQVANLPDVPESGNIPTDDGGSSIVAPNDVGGSELASTTLPIASNYGG